MKQYINDFGKWGTFEERFTFDLSYALKIFNEKVNRTNSPQAGEVIGIEQSTADFGTCVYWIVKISPDE